MPAISADAEIELEEIAVEVFYTARAKGGCHVGRRGVAASAPRLNERRMRPAPEALGQEGTTGCDGLPYRSTVACGALRATGGRPVCGMHEAAHVTRTPDGNSEPVWFAFNKSRRLAFFAGLWTGWTCTRKIAEGEVTCDLFAFLKTGPNAEVGAVRPKAMPVILTAPGLETWITSPWADACGLQRPLPDGALRIISRGAKQDPANSSRIVRMEEPQSGLLL